MVFRGGKVGWWCTCVILGTAAYLCAGDIEPVRRPADFRLERTDVPPGAELVTLFSIQPSKEAAEARDLEIPILSVLRDTLDDSDPGNDRLRQVWIYSYAKPSVWQRFVACLPFLYRQASPGRYKSVGLPRPVLDLAAPGRNTMRSVVNEIVQLGVLDDVSIPMRLASRSYRGSASDYRDLHVFQALMALSDLNESPARDGYLTQGDMDVLGARLTMATRLLGGAVGQNYLESTWNKETLKSNENRGHNWELLRQKAEETGLYFEPLSLGAGAQNFALLWVEQAAVASHPPRQFDGKFLGISDPFTDKRLRDWSGYTQTWFIDETGARAAGGSASARTARMIPLALYALDHPRVPLLLVDLRHPWKPGAKERARRIATDITINLLGWTSFGNWQFTVAKSALFFVRGRHGAPMDRSARLRAYAQLQHSLKLETSIDPELHRMLARHSQRLGINPFDNKPETQIGLAQEQHAALLASARSPNGLAARLEKDRGTELNADAHSAAGRTLFKVASVATFGLYHHRERVDEAGYLNLDQTRRFSYHRRFLEGVEQSGTRVDVAWDIDRVRRSLDTVLELGVKNAKVRPAAQEFVSGLCKKTGDDTIRQQCAAGLLKLHSAKQIGKPALSLGPTAGAGSASAGASDNAALNR